MPGGSINGRPLRESRDSYSKTGIPCGNPKRFHSQDVVRMEAGMRSRSQPIDGPLEEIETEGQRQLKALLHKQLDTDVSIPQQLSRKREFSHGAEFTPVTEELVGVRSLSEVRSLGDVDSYIEEMKGYGLTHEEILYKLRADDGGKEQKKSRLSNPEYHGARLKEIDEKISKKKQLLDQADTFASVKPISRHEMDLEKAISGGNAQNKFLHTALVTQRQTCTSTSNTVMDDIPEILESISSKPVYRHLRKNKTNRHAYKADCTLECCRPVQSTCEKCEKIRNENCVFGDSSHERDVGICSHMQAFATCMEKPDSYVSVPEPLETEKPKVKVHTKSSSYVVKFNTSDACKLSQSGSDSNTKREDTFREIEQVEQVPEHVIRKYKLSDDEVKNIPRFQNYSPGEPNNVLFVKNLSPRATEEDLASLFVGFQTQPCSIVFKLLTGKMKGQAFVTFQDTETATKALDLVHGYMFKEKPVIIQYGKKQQ
ncbi:RNA-binding protein 41-like [Mya arenaria]|uniref:RNA-binding protein 41-like n=1 Tax=Mya arenaria TaxID=6604 RepID=UPI0022E7B117|nr:RNA-binding protein 41-like [Mya arenaria]